MSIQDRILQLCKERKWSLYKLAHMAGLSETTVYDWFNENHNTPSRNSIEDICAAFEITISEFYAGVEIPEFTDKEISLINLFRKVPEAKKSLVIDIIRSFTEK